MPRLEPTLRCRCADCGTEFSLHAHTVCPHCFGREWEPLPDSPCTCTLMPSSSAYAMNAKGYIIEDSLTCPVHGKAEAEINLKLANRQRPAE